MPLDDSWRARLRADANSFSDAAPRTLAVACRPPAASEVPAAGAATPALEPALTFVGTVTGAEIDLLDEAGFAAAVRVRSVFARVAPSHKLRIARALQAGGRVAAKWWR